MANTISDIESLGKDAQSLYDVLNEEADFACVLIGASYLDQVLASILERFFIKGETSKELLDPIGGALGTFAARSQLCYCLGLISKGMYKNLMIIARLRNQFAHKHLMLKFEDKDISELVNELTFPKITSISVTIAENETSDNSNFLVLIGKHPRDRFNSAAVMLVSRLLLIGLEIQRRQRKTDGWD